MAIKTQDFAGAVFLDPQDFEKRVRYTTTKAGQSVLSFQLVSQDRRQNERQEWETVAQHYQKCHVWDSKNRPYATALYELFQQRMAASPGQMVRLELSGVGKLVTRKWQDRDGNNQYSPEVTLYSVAVDVLAVQPVQQQSQSQAARDWDSRPSDNGWNTVKDEEPPF